ncbi:RBBP9/YdeN family alpha/beta hydrolase [Patescibacteria group bacterium]
MNKPTKIILIHGNGGGTGTDYWFPYVKAQFESLDIPVIAETFPDSVEAKAAVWLPHLEKLGADEHTILIGHSSGAVATLRYAENHKLYGSVLVGVNHTDLGLESEKISGYYDHPWKWDVINKNQKWIILFASKDDPYIPIDEPRYIHRQLKCEYNEYTDKGHFGTVDSKRGYDRPMTEFPELVASVKGKLS